MSKPFHSPLYFSIGPVIDYNAFVNDGEFLQDQVRTIAYLNWLQAGCPKDRDLNFWLLAEKETCQDVSVKPKID